MKRNSKVGQTKNIKLPNNQINQPQTALKPKPDKFFQRIDLPNLDEPIYMKKLFWGLIIIIAIVFSFMSFSYGVSGDERLHIVYGHKAIKFYQSFGQDTSLFALPIDVDRDQNIRFYGPSFNMFAVLMAKILPFDDYTTDHLLIALLGIIMIIFTSLIIKRFTNYTYSILGALLFACSPYFLGHTFNNPKDIPYAAFTIMAIYFIIDFFEKYPTVKKIDYFWISLSIALTISIRVGGIILYPYIICFLFFKEAFQNGFFAIFSKIKYYFKPVIIIFLISFALASFLWPYALISPIDHTKEALAEMSNFSHQLLQVFQGKKVYPSETPSYLPLNLLYTNSVPVIIGLIIGLLGLLFSLFNPSLKKIKNAPILYFIGFSFLFPIFYIIYKKSTLYHAWRHVLFILPSIIIIATLGWYIINYFLSKWIHISFKKIGVVVGFICLIEPVSFIVSTFPFTNTYYNFFVGGTAQAFGNYEMDSYGNSLKPVSDWFIKNVVPTLPKNKETVVATNYPQILNIYLDPAKDSNLKNIRIVYVRPTEKNNAYWDYCIMHSVVNMPLDQLKYNAWVPQHYLYEAKVKGKTLCVLYKRPSFDDLKGFEYMNKNNGDSALYYFTNYLKFEPKDITILNSISNIYLSLNQTSKADSFIQLTLSIDPGDYTANYIIGLSRLRQNKFAEAIENFKLIVAQSPYNFDASYYLGVCYYQTRDLRSAYESFSNVLGGQYQEASAKYLNEIEPQLP